MAHVLKLSDEELYFLTGEDSIEAAKEKLFVGNVHLLIYTRGADGAECYTKKANAQSKGKKVKAVDTTGAGDAFIGSFLYQLYADGVTEADLPELTSDKMAVYLDFLTGIVRRVCRKPELLPRIQPWLKWKNRIKKT